MRLLNRLWCAVGATAVLTSGLAFSASLTPVSAAGGSVTAVNGSAYGYRAFNITLFGGAQADTGPTPTVALATNASNSPQSATATTGLVAYGPATMFTSDGISVQTTGSLGTSGSVTSTSSINDINKATTQIGTGSEEVTADNVSSSCSSGNPTGATIVTNGTVATLSGSADPNPPTIVSVPTNPPVNTAISGQIDISASDTESFNYVFNEQSTDSSGNLTVNAVHEHFLGPTLKGDLVIGQVICGTTPTTSAPFAGPINDGFPNQQVGTTSSAQTVTFTNPTNSAVTVWVGAPTGTNASDFSITSNGCGTSSTNTVSVAGHGGTCSLQVTFAPSAFGARSATLTFNDGSSPLPTVGLTGGADSAKVAVVDACTGSGCSGGALYAKQDAQPYQGLGGVIEAAPTVASVPGPNGAAPMVIYIGLGSDTNLYVRSDTQGWQAFGPPGTSCLDSPGAVVTPPNASGYTLTIACQGSDHALYYAQVPLTWGTLPSIGSGGWTFLGGALNAGPAVTAINGQISFIVTGGGGQLYQRGISTGYTAINGQCLYHVAVANNEAGTAAYLACHGTDHGLYLSVNNGSGWGAFNALGGVMQQSPGIAVTSTEVTLWVEGSNTAIYHRTTNLAGTSPSGYVFDGGSVQFGAAGIGMIAT
jgi:hypothetical protein